MPRCILHLDMDAFYASVEQRDHPEYRGRPVVVGADPRNGLGRGVVAACSYEARKFGIRSALPIGQAWRLCPEAVFVRPRMADYVAVSRRIREILRSFTELVEPVSIDEAFLDLTPRLAQEVGPESGWWERAMDWARKIKQEIRDREALTASVGIAPNKFLAKVASDLRKPDGLVLVRPEEVLSFLDPLPISRLWGVGPRTEQRLHALGIRQVADLRATGQRELYRHFGSLGHHLWRLASGLDDRPVVTAREARSISRERTFGEDTRDLRLLEETVRRLAARVAQQLGRSGLAAGTVILKLRYADFTTFTRQISPRHPVVTEDRLAELGLGLLRRYWNPSLRVRLVGLGVSRLRARNRGQLALF
jgi:nucleotidyltransferase/DNA polymerase involved in DNA repair